MRFLLSAGSQPTVVGCGPLGTPKINEISRNVRKVFRWTLGGPWAAKMTPSIPQSSKKVSQKVTLGVFQRHFWAHNLNIGTLLKHCYLLQFRPKMELWDHNNSARNSDPARILPKAVHSGTFLCSLTHQVSSRAIIGRQRVSKGLQK